MSSWQDTVDAVMSRAGGRREYCRMHFSLQGTTFHVEDVCPSSRGGPTNLENLAWACPNYNLHKSDRIEAVDPNSGSVVPHYNPRTDAWHDHFRWNGHILIGGTAIARATVRALDLNHQRRIRIRQAEELFGLFPP